MVEARTTWAARLAALARHLPTFADPAAPVGAWHRPAGELGCTAADSFVLNAEAERFVADCRVHGWVLSGFDWSAWAQTAEAQRLRDNPAELARANEPQLSQLLTVVIRQDCFVEGAPVATLKNSLILGILQRAERLGSGSV